MKAEKNAARKPEESKEQKLEIDIEELDQVTGSGDPLPIYYYGMSGQMKTLLDRLNPLYPSDYRFRKVYLLTTAAEEEAFVPEQAVSGLRGWVDCFERAELAGSLFCGGVNDPGDAAGRQEALDAARRFGQGLE